MSILACGQDVTSPADDVAGYYRVVRWRIEGGERSIDVLAHGGDLWLRLAADGTVTGHFLVPAEASPRRLREDASMAGHWSIIADTVRFDQPADTYVRFATWVVRNRGLESVIRTGPWSITTILSR